MLDLAINYVEEVNILFRMSAFDIKYKYYHVNAYASINFIPEKSTWNKLEFVSLYKNEVKGFIECEFTNPYRNVHIIMLSTGSPEFLSDISEVIDKLFEIYNTPKISFSVLVGNPAEKLYDRFVKNHGGRIVGTKLRHTLNLVSEICDLKMYEILKEDYIK